MKQNLLFALGCAVIAASSSSSALASPSTDSSVAPAQAAPVVEDLGPVLEPIRAANDLPALAAAVMAGNRIVANGAVGVRKALDKTPVTLSDKWHLGSDTKAMTATLFATFVDEGKISWKTTLAEAFPDLGTTMDPAYRAVTLDQLMSHFGGAPHDVPSDIWSSMWKPGDSRAQRLLAVKAMLGRPPETPPGTKFVYANAGYMIVGAALELRTGIAWEDLMKSRIFAPLGMTSCGFGAPASDGLVDQPLGHDVKSGKLVPVAPHPRGDNPPSLGPAGTVHCSLASWGKFLAMQLAGARHESKFVSAASFEKLQTVWPGSDYAKGWMVAPRPWANGTALTHSGSNTMFYATAWIAPKLNRVFMVATNRGDSVAAKAVDAAFGPLIHQYSH